VRYSNHSSEFKEAIASKIMNRGSQTVNEICDEAGVNRSTAANWIQSRVKLTGMKKEVPKWSAENKLKAINESHGLSAEKQGEYLRKEGLHSHNLVEWRAEFISSLQSKRKNASKKDERDVKIKVLERDLLRKDKALAEVSALLILQKKVNLLWGTKGEDEK
jgi:transposase